jgi:hypothetical protein
MACSGSRSTAEAAQGSKRSKVGNYAALTMVLATVQYYIHCVGCKDGSRLAPAFSVYRYQQLLEESCDWVSREELIDRINQALDNPQPFGFVTNISRFMGY